LTLSLRNQTRAYVATALTSSSGIQTPLDEIDAAARILDPIFDVVNGAEPVHGKFIKDYASTTW